MLVGFELLEVHVTWSSCDGCYGGLTKQLEASPNSGFQVTGMFEAEDVFGFKIFYSGIFLSRKTRQVFFCVG